MKIKIASASVIGKGHLKYNKVCQDSNKKYQKKINILTLADGAGSKSHSHIGSKLLTSEICEYLKENFNKIYDGEYVSMRDELMEYLVKKLKNKQHNLSLNSIDQLASTLLFVAIKDKKFITGHIGDGVIGYIKNNELKVISKPENGEYANSTYFIHPNFKHMLRLGKGTIENINGFILMTDGGEDGLYDKQREELIESNKEIIYWLKNRESHRVEKALRKNIINNFRKITRDDVSIGAIYIGSSKSIIYKSKGSNINLSPNIVKKSLKKKFLKRI